MSPSTDTSKQPRTKYQQDTYLKQESSHKTVGGMLGQGISLIIFAVIVAFLVLVGAGIMKDQGNLILAAGGLVTLGMIFTGFSMILKSILGKNRKTVCPYCGKKVLLFHGARSFICDKCGHVLQLKGDEKELVKISCPDCEMEWAASPNLGAVRCFSCGAKGTIQNGEARFNIEAHSCPDCGTINPDGLYFCWQCGVMISAPEPVKEPDYDLGSGTLFVEQNKEGMDFITIRAASPSGLMINAVGRLNHLIPEVSQLPDPNYESSVLARQVQYCLQDMEEALDHHPEYAGSIRAILPGVTRVVARILKGIKVGTMAYGDTDQYNRFWADLSTLYNQLTKKVNPGVNLTFEKIGWPYQLVKVSRGGTIGTYNPPQFATIVDNEADIRDWVKQNLPDGELQPFLLPGMLNLEGLNLRDISSQGTGMKGTSNNVDAKVPDVLDQGADRVETDPAKSTTTAMEIYAGSSIKVTISETGNIQKDLMVLEEAPLVVFDSDVQKNVENALDRILAMGDEGVQTLLDRLNKDMKISGLYIEVLFSGDTAWNEWLKKREIVYSFGRARITSVVPLLITLVNASTGYQGFYEILQPAAARTLGQIGDKHAVEPLYKSLHSDNTANATRRAISESLEKLEGKPILDPVSIIAKADGMNKKQNGEEVLQLLAQIDPAMFETLTGQQKYYVWYMRGLVYKLQGDKTNAIECFQTSLNYFGDSTAMAHDHLRELELSLKDKPEPPAVVTSAPMRVSQPAQLPTAQPAQPRVETKKSPFSGNRRVILVSAVVMGVLLIGMVCFFGGITLFNKGVSGFNWIPASLPMVWSATGPTETFTPTVKPVPTKTTAPTQTPIPTETETPTIALTPTDQPLSASLAPAGWKVVFEDHFDASSSDHWRVGNRTLADFYEEIKDGKMIFLMGQDGHGGSLTSDVPDGMPDLGDFYARVEVRQPVGERKAACGLVYRYVDHFDYYSFGIHGSSAFTITSFVDGEFHWLADAKLDNAVSARKVNVLEIIASGSSIQFFINGETVYKDSNPAIPKGALGLIADSLTDPQALTCEFGNLEVRAP